MGKNSNAGPEQDVFDAPIDGAFDIHSKASERVKYSGLGDIQAAKVSSP